MGVELTEIETNTQNNNTKNLITDNKATKQLALLLSSLSRSTKKRYFKILQ